MGAIALLLGIVATIVVLDLGALVWGVDSREVLPDDHRR